MERISQEDMARFIDGKIEEPEELQRILDYLGEYPDSEAARYLVQTQENALTALAIPWAAMITPIRAKCRNSFQSQRDRAAAEREDRGTTGEIPPHAEDAE